MIQRLTKTLESASALARLTHTQASILFVPVDVAGTITAVKVEVGANLLGSGSALFNLRINGVAQWSGGSRLSIAAGAKAGSKTGLSIAVSELDDLLIDLEQLTSIAQVSLPIVVTVLIEDGVSVGASPQVIFSDDFSDGSVNAEWTNGGGGDPTVAESGGKIRLTSTAGGYLRTQNFPIGIRRSFEAALVGTVLVAASEYQSIEVGDGTKKHAIYTQSGNLKVYSTEGLSATTLTTYNPTTHKHLRIVIQNDTDVLFQTSPNGTAWTTVYSFAANSSNRTMAIYAYLRIVASTTVFGDFDDAKICDFSNFG